MKKFKAYDGSGGAALDSLSPKYVQPSSTKGEYE